jgi:UPF0716 family protein affecting phage T7 exclusion
VSSVVGIILCSQHLRGLTLRSDQAKQKTESSLTGEIQLIEGLDGLWTFLLMALYIFPGLLSDAIAFFFLMPPVKKWLLEVFVESLRKEAERRGKSLDDVLREKHQKPAPFVRCRPNRRNRFGSPLPKSSLMEFE